MALNQDIAFVVSLLKDGSESPEIASQVMKQFLRTRLTSAPGRLMLMDQFIDMLFHRYLTQHRSAVQLGCELKARLAPHVDSVMSDPETPDTAKVLRLHA
ncbi:MAG: hypothetical protein ACXU8U_07375 [Asticcacaulis sp.]